MTVKTQCGNPACQQTYEIAEEHVGKSIRCKHCGETFAVIATTSSTVNTPSRKTSLPSPSASVASHGSTSKRLPTNLGRFEVRERLGGGAFGMVYRAHDPQLDREVALKVPRPGTLDSPDLVERFLREAKAAAQLRHPNIVPIYDAGQDGEQSYIASAYIAGRSLEEAADGALADPKWAVKIVHALAEALDYAHGQGIIHRDIKPANVMLDSKDRPHVMDFGLARLESSAHKLTQDGTVMGTPAYMSPEQAAGHNHRVTAASDQYSLGVVFYELLTGQTPFSGLPQVVIVNILTQIPKPPRTLRPALPRDLETICLKAMAKESQQRYASCHDFAADLERWLRGEPIAARPISAAERLLRWAKRNPSIAILSGALSVTIAIAVTTIAILGLDAMQNANRLRDTVAKLEDQRRISTENLESAQKEAERARRAEQSAIKHQQSAESSLAALQAEQSNSKQLAMLRDQAEIKVQSAQSSVAEAERLKARTGRRREIYGEKLSEAASFVTAKNFASATVLLETLAAEIPEADRGWERRYLSRLAGAAEAVILPGNLYSMSPDGTLALVSVNPNRTQLGIVSTTTGRPIHKTRKQSHELADAFFTPDSSAIVYSLRDKDGSVTVRRVPTSSESWDGTQLSQPVRNATLLGVTHIDGDEWTLTMQKGGDSRLVSSEGKHRKTAPFIAHNGRTWSYGMHISGDIVFHAFNSERDAGAATVVADSLTDHAQKEVRMILDGFSKKRNVEYTSLGIRRVEAPTVAVDPTGKRVAYLLEGDGNVRIKHLQGNGASNTWHIHDKEIISLRWSEQGSLVATSGMDGLVRVWDPFTGTVKYEIATGRVIVDGLADNYRNVIVSGINPVKSQNLRRNLSLPSLLWRHSRDVIPVEELSMSGTIHCLSESGEYVVGISGNDAELLTLETQERLGFQCGNLDTVSSVHVSNDGRVLAAVVKQLGGADSIYLWDLHGPSRVAVPMTLNSPASELSFVLAPNGKSCYRNGESYLTFGGTDDTLTVLPSNQLSAPNSKQIVVSRSGSLLVTDENSVTAIGPKGDVKLNGRLGKILALSPDGQFCVAEAESGIVGAYVIDSDENKLLELHQFKSEIPGIRNAAFSPDGLRVAIVDKNGAVAICASDDGSKLLALTPGGAESQAVGFSEDGNRLTVLYKNGLVRSWVAIAEKPESTANQ